jgi:putative membrane-bound dehydrogenase-like protein
MKLAPASLPLCLVFCLGTGPASRLIPSARGADQPPAAPAEIFGSDRARTLAEKFPSRGALTDRSITPRSPQAAAASFKLAPGLRADAVLSEPDIRQPVSLNFDERGRLWVIEYIQYPYPAGLKIVGLDNQFHAVYDKVPPPPPYQDRGLDRISIHEDADGDGVFESHKVFQDGLNLVTATARGRGGVWVLNPPYLLFYPDANDDDIPDSAPLVHLAGFGLEDTHSVANSLAWGPDGWLWGAQGSGVSSKLRRPGIDEKEHLFKGQAIWRYHPERRVFELFAEGGGNTFSLAFDAAGRVFSGTNAGGVRGHHYEQGSYHSKGNWDEHGYLTNPYTFGFFTAMPHNWKSPRFSQSLAYYEDGQLGDGLEQRFIAPNALQHRVEITERLPHGSTYRTRDVGPLLESDDRWFRPVDTEIGPDGAIYLADWYDTRLSHQDPRDTWDKERGRIYRIRSADAHAPAKFDLAAKTSAELVTLLGHRQSFFRHTALRLLADRRDRSVAPQLRRLALDGANVRALDALWGLHAVGGFSAREVAMFLDHAQPDVRRWAVRLLGDHATEVPAPTAAALVRLAGGENDPQVRAQLAATARRLPAVAALPLVFALMARATDSDDPQIPLLVWWALENFAESHRDEILAGFSLPAAWAGDLARTHIIPRLAQRYAAYPTPENQRALAGLAKAAPADGRVLVRTGVAKAFEGRGIGGLSPEMEAVLFGEASNFSDPAQLALAIRRNDRNAIATSIGVVADERPDATADRVRVIEALADVQALPAKPALVEVLSRSRQPAVREAALAALGRYGDADIPSHVFRLWRDLDPGLRQRALAILTTRKSWARELFASAGHLGAVPTSEITPDIVERARRLGDGEIDKLADRYFGAAKSASSAEKQRRMEALTRLLATKATAQPAAGRAIYEARCAACHTLFARGGDIGPDLTAYERTNLPNILLGIIDPSLAIREGYALVQFVTRDNRTLVGFIAERDANRVILREASGQRLTIATADIQREQPLPVSLMPEGLLDGLSERETRDFFAYLTASADPTTTASSR